MTCVHFRIEIVFAHFVDFGESNFIDSTQTQQGWRFRTLIGRYFKQKQSVPFSNRHRQRLWFGLQCGQGESTRWIRYLVQVKTTYVDYHIDTRANFVRRDWMWLDSTKSAFSELLSCPTKDDGLCKKDSVTDRKITEAFVSSNLFNNHIELLVFSTERSCTRRTTLVHVRCASLANKKRRYLFAVKSGTKPNILARTMVEKSERQRQVNLSG